MFTLPSECPSCKGSLHYDSVNLWCLNIDCEAKTVGIASNFFKVMELKGFGPSTCEKLGTVVEILALSREEFITRLGVANGNKLYDMLLEAKDKKHDGAKVLAALSIPSVGKTTSPKLALLINNGELDITDSKLQEAGITPATRSKIIQWYSNDYQSIWGGVLPFRINDHHEVTNSSNKLGPTVCVTGKLDGFTRDSIKAHLTDKYGCKVVTTVSSKLDYLICNTLSTSSSYIKAQSLGIPILTLNQFEEKHND